MEMMKMKPAAKAFLGLGQRPVFFLATFLLVLTNAAWGVPLNNTARAVIPRDVQQIIVVDYRAMSNSPTAMALKDRVLPDPLKALEAALRANGINPDKDIEQLAFASYRTGDALRFVGVAQGQFPMQKFVLRLKKQKVKGSTYHGVTLFPMASGMSMVLLNDTEMIFGDSAAVKQALEARDGDIRSLNANTAITDLMSSVESDAIWSVLDQAGTQAMLKSALGSAADLADYDMVKSRLKGSRYRMSFSSGVDFKLDVITSDSITATALSSLVQAGVMFKKATSSDTEKAALENMEVRSDSNQVKMNFHTGDQQFQALLNSDLFTAVSK